MIRQLFEDSQDFLGVQMDFLVYSLEVEQRVETPPKGKDHLPSIMAFRGNSLLNFGGVNG